ncbi:Phosphinothricin N-acetyltransferase [compost metagenome]
MGELQFKEISDLDLYDVMETYNYYVKNSTASFHTEELTINEIRESVINLNPRYKSYIIIEEEKAVGYVLITQHKKKQAYDVSAEVTIYLHPNELGKGIGGRALSYIEEVAIHNGFHVLVATVCAENNQSRQLFEKNGYKQCAHYQEIGMKFGRRLDIFTYQKIVS